MPRAWAQRRRRSVHSSSAGEMRRLDEPIPPYEPLYRWIRRDQVNGAEVLPSAVDLSRTSVDRHKYAPSPLPPHHSTRPELNGVAGVCEDEFPTHLICNGVAYEFFSKDVPETFNDAHAEVRSGRRATADHPNGDRPDGFKPGSRAAKNGLRAALAESMRVIRPPTE